MAVKIWKFNEYPTKETYVHRTYKGARHHIKNFKAISIIDEVVDGELIFMIWMIKKNGKVLKYPSPNYIDSQTTILSHTKTIKSMITFESSLIALSEDNTKFVIFDINEDRERYKYNFNQKILKPDRPSIQADYQYQSICISSDKNSLIYSIENHLYSYNIVTEEIKN